MRLHSWHQCSAQPAECWKPGGMSKLCQEDHKCMCRDALHLEFFQAHSKKSQKTLLFFFFFLSLFFLSLKESSLTASLLFAPRWRRAAVSPMLSLCCGGAMPPAPNSRAVIHTFGKRRSQSCSLLLFLLHNNNRGISYQLPPSLPFKE